ncbi:MAG: hypothetical protein K8R53_03840 [Bacteroidales bacterium]|nr:hypothetical protein [Bacteroidales bacterium]
MAKILNLIAHPLFLALVITIGIFLALPPFFDKYTLEIVKTDKHISNQRFFHDIDHDGYDDLVVLGFELGLKSLPNLQFKTDFTPPNIYRHVSQVNLDREWVPDHFPFFGDYNHDKSDEAYIFMHNGDSLFLYGVNLFKAKIFFKKFIDTVCFEEDVPDFGLSSGHLADLNKDGCKEMIFTIKGGLCEKPRAIYAYNIKTDKLTKYDLSFADVRLYDNCIAVDKEYGPVITAYSSASGNVPDTSQSYYSDHYTWLMVFDSTLNFHFQPINYKKDSNELPRRKRTGYPMSL